jgi:putative SOS response-associated peptidase YedK
MGISEGLSRMSWKLSRTVLRGGVTGNGDALLGKGTKGQKLPMFITLPEGDPFAFAGLWETWSPKDDPDNIYKSCTIITTQSSDSVRDIHHRMPAILKPEMYEPWLDPLNQDVKGLENILKTGVVTELVSNPVSKNVNSVKNNEPSNIIPLPGF